MRIRAWIAFAVLLPSFVSAQVNPQQEATAAYERKDYATCGRIFSRLGHETKNNSLLYNAASCFALGGNRDAAFALLDEVMQNGWANRKLLLDDADLRSLHDDARWNGVIARAEANWKKLFGNDNAELWAIREADDADRQTEPADVNAAIARDRQRLARVKEIIAAGGLKTAMDYFIAAMIHQHGNTADDYLEAGALALRASVLDPANSRAKWLVAASFDRYLRRVGKPQIYGTQFKKIDGVWQLESIDETAVTDEERAKWSVPPLADAKRRAEEMNRKK